MGERIRKRSVDTTQGDGIPRDDRVLRITRWSGYVIAPVLFLAFVSLYGAPGSTERYFAWGISPDLTPLLMGAGYGAGVYFFYRVVTTDEWHRVHVLFPGIAVFTLAMGVATVLHWDAFTHGHFSTWLWVFLYVVTPVLIPALWVYNGRTDPGKPAPGYVTGGETTTGNGSPDDAAVPSVVRWTSGFVGVVLTAAILILFVWPEPMIDRWPWAVSPLTARVLLGWAFVFSVVSVFFAFETRRSAAKIPIESLVIWFGLLLVGFARSWGDVDSANPIMWVVLGGITVYLVGLSALYVLMERR
ncbi:hypothetical protein [Natrononativus amylolyticus]|uniref:hypothetical protein n=1 Tax=Natrononativus amylolyticus TaxID=2963434 RepID=UPI0020CDFBC8|nr:hypothetical protein [Natrononativus amylolyticus]